MTRIWIRSYIRFRWLCCPRITPEWVWPELATKIVISYHALSRTLEYAFYRMEINLKASGNWYQLNGTHRGLIAYSLARNSGLVRKKQTSGKYHQNPPALQWQNQAKVMFCRDPFGVPVNLHRNRNQGRWGSEKVEENEHWSQRVIVIGNRHDQVRRLTSTCGRNSLGLAVGWSGR